MGRVHSAPLYSLSLPFASFPAQVRSGFLLHLLSRVCGHASAPHLDNGNAGGRGMGKALDLAKALQGSGSVCCSSNGSDFFYFFEITTSGAGTKNNNKKNHSLKRTLSYSLDSTLLCHPLPSCTGPQTGQTLFTFLLFCPSYLPRKSESVFLPGLSLASHSSSFRMILRVDCLLLSVFQLTPFAEGELCSAADCV